MQILLCSTWYYPSFGGVETTSQILAEQFTASGATVTVVTSTPGPAMEAPYSLVRRPSQSQLLALVRKSDIVVQNLISLRMFLPPLLLRKPIVVVHQSWLRKLDGRRTWQHCVKLLATRACHNISISQAIADSLPVPSRVIGNPFDSREFGRSAAIPRDRDIVFLGRLVSDKGCDLLLHAFAKLQRNQSFPSLTIIGDGPEMAALRRLTGTLNLDRQVEFLGALREQRGPILSRHKIMAVPSLWPEPFGVVALEGIASGCAIVASSQGGLREAAGPCGVYFPNGDADALASRIEHLLTDGDARASLIANGASHLRHFQPERVAQKYLDVFKAILA